MERLTESNASDASTSDFKVPRLHFEYYKREKAWRWRLVAGNGEIVASGESYKRKRDCLSAIKLVRSSGKASVGEVEG
jgi:uncharacterized protein